MCLLVLEPLLRCGTFFGPQGRPSTSEATPPVAFAIWVVWFNSRLSRCDEEGDRR